MSRSAFSLVLAILISLTMSCKKPASPAHGSQPAAANSTSAGRTEDEIALLEASIKGDTATVKSLLDRGVNPNAKDPEGRTPLSEAAYYGHSEIAKLLIDHGADVLAKKKDGETPLTMAAGHKDIAEMINRELDLIAAAEKGDLKTVEDLIAKGASVNTRDADGRTPLTEATWGNHVEVVKLLLDKGANPNARKNDGVTALSIAKGKGLKEIGELLTKAGAK